MDRRSRIAIRFLHVFVVVSVAMVGYTFFVVKGRTQGLGHTHCALDVRWMCTHYNAIFINALSCTVAAVWRPATAARVSFGSHIRLTTTCGWWAWHCVDGRRHWGICRDAPSKFPNHLKNPPPPGASTTQTHSETNAQAMPKLFKTKWYTRTTRHRTRI